jgi:hypothetical protein
MASSRDRIAQQLRERVCSVCYAELREGSCGLPHGVSCPLFQRLDDVIAAVADTRSDRFDAYVDRVREVVCSTCRMKDDGFCDRREVLDCALDMYLPLVVEIIQNSMARHKASAQR